VHATVLPIRYKLLNISRFEFSSLGLVSPMLPSHREVKFSIGIPNRFWNSYSISTLKPN